MIPPFKIMQIAAGAFHTSLRSHTHPTGSCTILQDSLGYCRILGKNYFANLGKNYYGYLGKNLGNSK